MGPTSFLCFSLRSRVISNTTARRRDRESSMEREKPAGVRRCRDTQRALVQSSEPWGQGHTQPEQDLAQLLRQHPAIQGLCSVLPLTGRTEKEKEGKKKAGKWPQAPLPSRLYSQQHHLPLHLHLPGQGELPWGLRGRRSCPFPSPTQPHSHVQGAV